MCILILLRKYLVNLYKCLWMLQFPLRTLCSFVHHAFYSEFKGCIIDITTYSINLMVLRFRGLLLMVPFQAGVSARTMETKFLLCKLDRFLEGKKKRLTMDTSVREYSLQWAWVTKGLYLQIRGPTLTAAGLSLKCTQATWVTENLPYPPNPNSLCRPFRLLLAPIESVTALPIGP